MNESAEQIEIYIKLINEFLEKNNDNLAYIKAVYTVAKYNQPEKGCAI